MGFIDGAWGAFACALVLLATAGIYAIYRYLKDKSTVNQLDKEYRSLMDSLHTQPPSLKTKRPEFFSEIRKITAALEQLRQAEFVTSKFQSKGNSQQIDNLILVNKTFLWSYIQEQLQDDAAALNFESSREDLYSIETKISKIKSMLAHDVGSRIACWPVKAYADSLLWVFSIVNAMIEELFTKHETPSSISNSIRFNLQRIGYIVQKYLSENIDKKYNPTDLKNNTTKITKQIEEEMENAFYVYLESFSIIKRGTLTIMALSADKGSIDIQKHVKSTLALNQPSLDDSKIDIFDHKTNEKTNARINEGLEVKIEENIEFKNDGDAVQSESKSDSIAL